MRTFPARSVALRRALGGLLALVVIAGCGPATTTSPPSQRPSASPSPSASGVASGPTRIPLLLDVQAPVGTTRVLFGMLDAKSASIGAPDLTVSVASTTSPSPRRSP